MAYPYGPEDVIPFGMMPQPQPEPEPDLMSLLNPPQEALPNDYFARVAQTAGPQPFGSMNIGQKPTGLEALLALLSGFANAKATQGARRVNAVEQRNMQAREAAKTLANWRHQERLARQQQEATKQNAATARAENQKFMGEQRALDRENRSQIAGLVAGQKTTTNRRQLFTSLGNEVRQDPDIKEYPAIRNSYNTAREGAAQNNSSGDIILMRMLAKATDPTTGVREEEFKTFAGAQGELARRGVSMTAGMIGNGMLTPEGRKRLMDAMEGIHSRALDNYGRARGFYENQARQLGLDPKDVVRDYEAPAGDVVRWGRDKNGNPVKL